jgi:hypothetical protein
VLGESNRISAPPALPIEKELRKHVEAETAAQEDRLRTPKFWRGRARQRGAKGVEVDSTVAPTPIEPEAEAEVAVESRHVPRRRARRLVAAKPLMNEPPASDTEAHAETVEPEMVVEPEPEPEPEVVEAPLAEPEVAVATPVVETKIVFVPEAVEAVVAEPEVVEPEVVEPEVVEPEVAEPEVETPVAETKIVFVPETVEAVVAEPQVVEEPPQVGEPEPDDREVVIPEVVTPSFVIEREAPVGVHGPTVRRLFTAKARKPRVKKVAKGRRGWVVDYVVPESQAKDAGR